MPALPIPIALWLAQHGRTVLRWVLGAAALALGIVTIVTAIYSAGERATRAKWQADIQQRNLYHAERTAALLAKARQLEQTLAQRTKEIDHAHQATLTRLAADRADAARQLDGLRRALAAQRNGRLSNAAPAAATGRPDAATAAGDALEACGAELVDVAAVADRTAAQLIDLQDWARAVTQLHDIKD